MRVFVAGASGVIGRPLLRQLVAAGHEVVGMTSTERNVALVEQAGGRAAVCDALDPDAVREVVAAAGPEVVVSQLTRLPKDRFDPRTIDYGPSDRARYEGGRNLIAAALAAGARRFVTQSVAFLYAPGGGAVNDEESPIWTDAPEPLAGALRATVAHEAEALSTAGLDGLVLRYGQLYGPGTYYAADGGIAADVRRRRFPVVGRGDGVFSFVHTEDAAGATVAAVERGAPGIYNIVDDEPAPIREWLPVYARALGARPPRRVPAWLARLVAGRLAVAMATGVRGATNAKAKRELTWRPRYASWREGFFEALG